jgi:putative CocE/NonD family hydrolase
VIVCALALAAPASAYTPPQPRYDTVKGEEYVRMDDGVELAAEVGRPAHGETAAPGRFPVILTFTPYSKALGGPDDYWVSRGFVHVVADIRGAGESGGNLNENYFSPREQKDGAALVQHFGAAPWSNGRVGMIGGSYEGITQYMTAGQQPSHLKAIVPAVALEDLYRDAAYHGGILSQFFGAQYLALQQNGTGLLSGPQDPENPDKMAQAKADQAQSESIAWDYLANSTYTRFYRERSPGPLAGRIQVPTLIYDGWFDGFLRGASEMWRHLQGRRGVETDLWIDPVPHKGPAGLPFNPQGYPAAKLDSFTSRALEFLDRQLNGASPPARPRVKLYVTGRDRYITGDSWPPAGVRYTRYFLRPGSLAPSPAGTGEESFFTNPLDGWTNTLGRHGDLAVTPYLPLDQSKESHEGLVWQTPTLDKSLTLAGPISMHLVARSTAPDTDWFVRVSDVAPGGEATLLTEGFLRASHRALDRRRSRPERPYHPHTNPTPIEPGAWVPYEVEVWPAANEFRPGHRLQIQLASNDTPNHTPGTATVDKEDPARFELRPNLPALNSVRYGGRDGSSVLLPVLP